MIRNLKIYNNKMKFLNKNLKKLIYNSKNKYQ